MTLPNYSTDLWVFTVNGREITDWGETATPFTEGPIDPKRILRRGQGGRAVRLDRINPGRTVSLYLNPGSPDSAYMQGLFNSGANVEVAGTQIGTLETIAGLEGIVVNDAQTGRAGTTITDDQFTMEFNVWSGLKGGK
ncbi:MAG: hypothetical protein ACRDCE_22035 [Cetobacterium sp.]|uniref:hypothetical protein n=1 Tax=Cetobacterium sp. TaxID=2071632 RepID=UPI003EE456A5